VLTVILLPMKFLSTRIIYSSLSLLILQLFSSPALAKKLYQYQDSKGQWHYSDKPPQTKQKVAVKQLRVEHKKYITLQKTKKDGLRSYQVFNEYHAPVELRFFLKKSENVETTPVLPKKFVVEHGLSEPLFTVSQKSKFRGWSYNLSYKYTVGSPFAQQGENAVYLPPFAKDAKFRISQAFNGKFSHHNDYNRYAVDIVMPLKTPIHATRVGIVVDVRNDFFKNGLTQSHKSRANKIRILHDDGTMASYVHLSLETVQVYEGLKVSAGQLIGYSGNTGYSTGPHLHFSIMQNKGMNLVSIPFRFTTKKGAQKPKRGDWLSW